MTGKKSLKVRLLTLVKSFVLAMKLDKNEVNFIRNNQKQPNGKLSKGSVLVQVPTDHYFLLVAKEAISALEEKHGALQKIGIWPYSILPTRKQSNKLKEGIHLIYNNLLYFLQKRKWLKLYSALGVEHILLQTNGNFLVKLKCKKLASQVFNGLKTKQDVLNIKYRDVELGDLIYDTYLRFRNEATVDIDDGFLRKIIYTAFVSVDVMNNFFDKNKINFYLTTYASYIHHGIVVRVALSHNVEVYSEGNNAQHFKKLSLDDNSHATNFKSYYVDFQYLKNKKDKLNLSSRILKKRFSGNIDEATKYMKKSAFGESDIFFNKNFDGVIFLHDFFDSPHCWGDMLFPDFWEWVCFTFDLIKNNNLNVGVKLHPNRNKDGAVVAKLKRIYPNIIWIDSSISNNIIFSSGIKFGVSVYGTVLSELAYHGINAISAGDHPAMYFDFVHNPNSVEEYKNFILNASALKMPLDYKEQVLAFFYMHTQSHKDGIKTKIDRQHLNAGAVHDSSLLVKTNVINLKGR